MLKRNMAAWCVVAVIGLASCAKTGPTGPQGVAGPTLTGAISGHVKLFDMYGSPVTLPTSLAKASLLLQPNGTTVAADVNGAYGFPTLITGIYSIQVSDSAYATTIKNNIQLVTGALNVDMRMSAIPDSFINTFTCFRDTVTAVDSLVLTFEPDTRMRNCIVFASSSPAVGTVPGTYLYAKTLSISPTAPLVNYKVPAQDLYNVGFAKGGNVYYAAYSYAVADASVYEDQSTGQMVYNAVNAHALIDSTQVP